MEVRIPKRTLAEGLGILERVIPSRSSNPILTYLPIELGNKGLVIKGTNGEIDLEVHLPAETQGEGHVLVPAQPFFQIVRSLPGELVEMVIKNVSSTGGGMALSSANFRTQLSFYGFPCEDELSSGNKLHRSFSEAAHPDLRALQILQDSYRLA